MPASGSNIVFFGTEDFSLSALRSLVDAGYHVALVVTKPDRPHGRGLKTRQPAVKTYAEAAGIPVLQPDSVRDCDEAIAEVPGRIGVLSSYGKIIPDSTLALFDRGIINIHPSLLPKYRGPSPIESAIMAGDDQTGVSIMRLVSAMDAGPVYAQIPVTIDPSMTARDLYTLCAQSGGRLLLETLPRIISGDVSPVDQDDSRASYTKLLSKKDSLVDQQLMTAADISRHIRAYIDYPRTKIQVSGHEVIITRAHVGDAASGLVITCRDDTKLTIDELIAPSGRTMSGDDFARGYKKTT